MRIKQKTLFALIGLIISSSVLIVTALQYPLSSTFPMGGDAPYYIVTTKNILHFFSHPKLSFSTLTGSWYPLSFIIFSVTALTPITWPMRFVWWAAFGQIASGASLGWLSYKIGGYRASIASILLWSMAPIMALRHFEDGTIAQLWSYVFLFLFFERFYSRSRWGALFFLLLTILSHSITGLILIIALACSVLPLWIIRKKLSRSEKKQILFFTLIITTGGILGTLLFIDRISILNTIHFSPNPDSFLDFVNYKVTILLTLIPVGVLSLYKKNKNHKTGLVLLTSFLFLAFLIAFQDHVIKSSLWTVRLYPFLFISTCIFGSIALARITTSVLHKKSLLALFFIISSITIGVTVWQNNKFFYHYYEDTDHHYARLIPEELAAIEWLKQNITSPTKIVSTNENRHSEWIPALTSHQLTIVSRKYPINKKKDNTEYMIYFLNREKVPSEILASPEKYPVVFQNDKTVIILLNKKQ